MEARRREARERRIGFRGRIVGMHEAGQSIRAIANNLGISTRTVLRWIRSSLPALTLVMARQNSPDLLQLFDGYLIDDLSDLGSDEEIQKMKAVKKASPVIILSRLMTHAKDDKGNEHVVVRW
ncbi:hypothetical protein Pcinc_015143 [Petrolisthes cinctipes]|uniref:Uncharacterized protein n=1 Tax=Petrolisthes cinctipes TaxID=88211 RepID=A0AAE1FTR6_PETCI|nr:hypothetical protein Pcinc_015143 [Petrolisthes cinctipes]